MCNVFPVLLGLYSFMRYSFVVRILLTVDKIHVDSGTFKRVGPGGEIAICAERPYDCQTRLRVQASSLASTQGCEFAVVW